MDQQKNDRWYSDLIESVADFGLEYGLDWIGELISALF
jgi:hypothetical protein